MKSLHPFLSACVLVIIADTSLFAAPPELQEDATFELNGLAMTLRKLETLPFVDSDYTKRFKFDSSSNPKLASLRERYKLDVVIAPGRDEFDQQVHLMDWTHQQFRKFGRRRPVDR